MSQNGQPGLQDNGIANPSEDSTDNPIEGERGGSAGPGPAQLGPDQLGPAQRFRRYWTSRTAGSLAASVTSVSLSLLAVVQLQADASLVGVVAAAQDAAWLLLSLPIGAVLHRLPMRALQIAVDLARAGIALALVAAAVGGLLGLPQLLLSAALLGVAAVIFDLANQSYLPRIVPAEELQRRNSTISATDAVTTMGGGGLAGFLAQAVGAAGALLVSAVGSVVSALALRSLPAGRQAGGQEGESAGAAGAEPAPREPMLAAIATGWRYVMGHRVLRPATLSVTVLNFLCGAQLTLFPLFLVRELRLPVGWVGLLLASDGVGSLIGAVLATRVAARWGTARASVIATCVVVVGAAVIPLGAAYGAAIGAAFFLAGNVLFAGGVVIISIVTRTYRMRTTPEELLPRVISTVRFVSWGGIPIGSLLAGVAASAWGTTVSLWACAAIALGGPALLLAARAFRVRELG
ncbi:MAG: MFS transporter [Arthrobacter sp.]|nr:MFS transporter [Arthrobacter sp.]